MKGYLTQASVKPATAAIHLDAMRVFGIDCGTEVTGFGVVESDSGGREPRLVCKAMGAIRLKKTKTTAERLEQVYRELIAELERWQPDAVAIEEVFYSVNAKSALKLGQVRGVALLAAACCKLPVAEYAPLKIKVERCGLRAGKKRAGPVHGGPAAWPCRVAPAGGCCRCPGNRDMPYSYRRDAGNSKPGTWTGTAPCAGGGTMKAPWPAFLLLSIIAIAPCINCQSAPAAAAVVVADFTNPGTSPSHWTLTIHRDGSAHFRSERGDPPPSATAEMETPNVDRDVQLSEDFAMRAFQTAQEHHWFDEQCDSHLKVAFQGWKKLSYSGPEGDGACTFNYSKDKDIQALGDQLIGVAETILEGARLESLLQHDRLGLDRETEFLMDAAKDGRIRQICAIRDILERLEDDPEVLDRVRKRARVLLAHAGR